MYVICKGRPVIPHTHIHIPAAPSVVDDVARVTAVSTTVNHFSVSPAAACRFSTYILKMTITIPTVVIMNRTRTAAATIIPTSVLTAYNILTDLTAHSAPGLYHAWQVSFLGRTVFLKGLPSKPS